MIKLIKTTLGTGHDGTLFVCPRSLLKEEKIISSVQPHPR
jgi:hypothetical protein